MLPETKANLVSAHTVSPDDISNRIRQLRGRRNYADISGHGLCGKEQGRDALERVMTPIFARPKI